MTDRCDHPGCGPGHDCEGQESLRQLLYQIWDAEHLHRAAGIDYDAACLARDEARKEWPDTIEADGIESCWHWEAGPCPACLGYDVGGLSHSEEAEP